MIPEECNLEVRDPNGIHESFRIAFEDVLAEPEGVQSIDCVWKMSFKCFNFWKYFCYNIATVLCGVCIAAHWGCEFAYIAFYHIWFFTPALSIFNLHCMNCQKIWTVLVTCCLEPICVSCSKCLEPFRKG